MQQISTTAQFDELLTQDRKVIVKFYTTWCPDCHRIDKVWEEYADTHSDRAAFAQLDADQVREIAERYDVRGIPSFLVFQKGDLVDRLYSRDAKTAAQVTSFGDKVLQK